MKETVEQARMREKAKYDYELAYQTRWAEVFKENKLNALEYWRKYRFLDDIKAILQITEGTKVLDVGCGISTVLHYVAGEKVGIDPLADEYLKLYEYPEGISIRKALGEDLPFPDDSFDVVFCSNVLDHVTSPSETLDEIHRVLRPTGYFVLTVEVFREKTTRTVAHPHCLTKRDVYSLLRGRFKTIFEGKSPYVVCMHYVLGSRKSFRQTKELIMVLRPMQRGLKERLSNLWIYRTNQRSVEYPFAIENLPESGRLLDVGCKDSELILELAKLNKFEVWGIDIRDFDTRGLPIKFVKGDIRSRLFEADFFDVITAISTIEHVGLSHYGNTWIDPSGDVVAMREIRRILKPEGIAIITIDAGLKGGFKGGKRRIKWFRAYNSQSVNRLLHGWSVQKIKWYEKTRGRWVECDVATASKRAPEIERVGVRMLVRAQACVCMVLSKIGFD